MSADDTNQFAGEAEEARERISATLDELGDRLNPRRIVGDAVGSVQASGQELVHRGLDLARAHPIVLAAAGLALGVAAIGSTRIRGAKVDFGDASESYSDYDDDYEEHAPAGASGERFALLRGGGPAVADNPLLAVVFGLAAGALIGALFPETERERRLLGASRDRLAAAARAAARTAREELVTAADKVGDVTSHARSAVQSVVDVVKTELKSTVG